MSKHVPVEIRVGFVRKVYLILCAQLVLTVAIAAPMQRLDVHWLRGHAWVMYLSCGAVFASMCVMMCCADQLRKFPGNFMFLTVFTAAMGVMVGFVSCTYTWQSVVLAAGITLLVFVTLTAYAWLTKTDFTGFGPYLFAAISAFCLFGFVLAIMGWCGIHIRWTIIFYDIVGILIFSFYIIYDTQLILGDWGGHKVQFSIDDYVFAALNLYLDIINLFILILELMGSRKN